MWVQKTAILEAAAASHSQLNSVCNIEIYSHSNYRTFMTDWCMALTILYQPSTLWSALQDYSSTFSIMCIYTVHKVAPLIFLIAASDTINSTVCSYSLQQRSGITYNSLTLSILSFPFLPPPLLRQGFITQEDCAVLNELYNYNPLLFDFACKRLVRGPSGEQFPLQVFKAHPLLPPFRGDSTPLGSGSPV